MTSHRTDSNAGYRPEHCLGGRNAGLGSWVRLVAGAIGLALATGALWWSGRALPAPSTFDRQGAEAWLGASDPVVAAFALVRLAGLALAAWVALSGGLALVVHLSRLRRRRWLRRLVDRLCLPVVRRLVHGVAGVTLVVTTFAPGAAGAIDQVATTTVGPSSDVATLVALPSSAPTSSLPPTTSADRAVIVAIGPESTSSPPAAPDADAGASPTSESESSEPPFPGSPAFASPAPMASRATDGTGPETRGVGEEDRLLRGATEDRIWRIEPGQHLWHVAESILVERLGATPGDEAVDAYLDLLIAANRDRLVVPDNPDLVFAGQEFVLPTSPPSR